MRNVGEYEDYGLSEGHGMHGMEFGVRVGKHYIGVRYQSMGGSGLRLKGRDLRLLRAFSGVPTCGLVPICIHSLFVS